MSERGGPEHAPELEELLQRLRQSGLRLDREGRWWHEGQQVEHRGLARALHRWLDRLDDGRYVVRLDAERFAHVEVEDAPHGVLTVTLEPQPGGPAVRAHLSDGSDEQLAYHTLQVGQHNALYCRVKGGRFRARFARAAYYLLAEHIVETDEGFGLKAAGKVWEIGTGTTRTGATKWPKT